jgi:HEAT repeat protein
MYALDAKAVEYLRMLVNGDDSDREKAAKELRKFNVPPVVTALIGALQRDGYSDAREQAANSLGEMLARDAQPSLRQAAREDTDKSVRKAALKAAVKIEAAYQIQP